MDAKPWKSFPEQLQILKDRGLQVDDEAAALSYLERVGYYRLSGYWYSFRQLEWVADSHGNTRQQRLDQFVDGAHFEQAVKLYVFDKKLRLLALDALERIEMAVRVDLAHRLGERDIHAHENPALFHGHFSRQKNKRSGKTAHEFWLEKYQTQLHRARNEPFVAHYLRQYGRLPVWVAVEVWDFGSLSKMFAGLKPADQQAIAIKYGPVDGKTLQNWLRSLNFIRNVAAHHSRLWNINVLERSAPITDNPFWQSLNNARPFFYFCVMQQLMRVICPNSSWSERVATLLKEEFPDVPANTISLADFGVVGGWEQTRLWGQK